MATNLKLHFSTALLKSGKTETGIIIPNELMERLGGGKIPLVKVIINGFILRGAIAVMNGVFMVGVNTLNRRAAGINSGDKIDEAIKLDNEKTIVELPFEFKKVLYKNMWAKKRSNCYLTTNKSIDRTYYQWKY